MLNRDQQNPFYWLVCIICEVSRSITKDPIYIDKDTGLVPVMHALCF